MFSIGFEPPGDREGPDGQLWGRLTFGDWTERFLASPAYWGPGEYEASWRHQVERVWSGAGDGALITEMHDPAHANFIVWWPFKQEHERVRIRNCLLFLDRLTEPFQPHSPELALAEPAIDPWRDDDAAEVSEWSVTVDDLRMFLFGGAG